MSKRVLILGAGTGGTMLANRLTRSLPTGWEVVVVDRDDTHIYQPGLLLLPFGVYTPQSLVRPRLAQLLPSVQTVLGEVDLIEPDQRQVRLVDGTVLSWDLLVVATGARVAREALEGLTGPGWRENRTDFYDMEGSIAAGRLLNAMESGHLVVHLHELPIKCPVAPLEFTFLAEALMDQRGLRDKVEITFVTPLDAAFTKPVASRALGQLLDSRGVNVVADFAAEKVEGSSMTAYDGRTLDFDLLISTPLHKGDAAVERSGLGDLLGFLPTDPNTLQSRAHPHIWALGDCTDLPTSKAGSVAHFQAEVLADNLLGHMVGRPPESFFDGHANCFIETGNGKALLIDFNYATEPLPGRYPLPGVGPFTLLEESVTNHLGKLAFKWLYWSELLPGKELPIGHHMQKEGKWTA